MLTSFENHLYDRNYFEHDLIRDCADINDSDAIFDRLAEYRGKIETAGSNEAETEAEIIIPVLKLLGWTCLRQQSSTIFGKGIRPDLSLFRDEESKAKFQSAPPDKQSDTDIVCVMESKATDKVLDTGKADPKENPFWQLMQYLALSKREFGFMSNGREFWYVDNTEVSREKRYIKVDFSALVEKRDRNELRIFFHLFSPASYVVADGEAQSAHAKIREQDLQRRAASEAELRQIFYGTDSLFEQAGRNILKHWDGTASVSLDNLFANTLYFTFRLLFIAFFEDRNWHILEGHSNYPDISLRRIFQKLKEQQNESYTGWHDLRSLFSSLDKGNSDLQIPLFNGGLFDDKKAPLVDTSRVMNNSQLFQIISMLLESQGGLRDFSTLSVISMGTMYEGLLEFEFRIAEEDQYYLEYKPKKGKVVVEGYFDAYDYAKIQGNKKLEILQSREFKKGSLYLVSNKNSRKSSASYYTPTSLAAPLVREAVDNALANLGPDESIVDLRILDNACGSGHLLVESLHYLTECALRRISEHADERLENIVQEEKRRIDAALADLGLPPDLADVDELAVLKRVLLKRVIYGVDLHAFAIDLAHLSLWIETFIFGTPLSFIEHHVKQGNSLIGCRRSVFEKRMSMAQTGQLLQYLDTTIKDHFKRLPVLFAELNAISDVTAEDIEKSKRKFAEITPYLDQMNTFFDVINMTDMMEAEAEAEKDLAKSRNDADGKKKAKQKKATASILREQFFIRTQKLLSQEGDSLRQQVQGYRRKYTFFNWALEFPEVFAHPDKSRQGFHVVIGNPPWDKTKFADPDFFSQFRADYRGKSNSEKKRIRVEWLAKKEIAERYDRELLFVKAVNNYLKNAFPYNEGAGDGNLFRFFVENNLRFLRVGGTLDYILPTALLTDDGSTTLRKHIFEHYHIRSFDGFENREKLFKDVDVRYKYGILRIACEAPDPVDSKNITRCRFMLTSPSSLEDSTTAFDYSLSDIKATSPDYMAYMEAERGRDDLAILKRIYQNEFKPLDPDWLDFRNELHATSDKSIFHEDKKDGYLPLYQGSCVWQYDSQYWERTGSDKNEPEYWLAPEEFDKHLLKEEKSRCIEDIFPFVFNNTKLTQEKNVLKALGLSRRDELEKFVVPDRGSFRLGIRTIASDTNERSLIAAVISPNIGAQHSMWLSIPKRYRLDVDAKTIFPEYVSSQRIFFLQALLDSIILDWVLRFSVSTNVLKSNIARLPILQPTDSDIRNDKRLWELTQNSLLLSCAYNKAFFELLPQFGLAEKQVPTTPKLIDMLKIRNDVLVAELYGVSKEEMRHILQSFKVLNGKHPEYGATLLEKM